LLSELQLVVSAEEARTILARVRKHAVEHKGAVARETVTAIWREVRERSLLNCA
jgi:homocitrate synthase NifV